jgi:hypothetical protein
MKRKTGGQQSEVPEQKRKRCNLSLPKKMESAPTQSKKSIKRTWEDWERQVDTFILACIQPPR